MRTAIITLAIGRYRAYFETFCRANWTSYCERHGIDLLVIDEPVDRSERAAARSPAWQKLLLFGLPTVAAYDAVCFLDADIFINSARAPSVFDGFRTDRVGVCAFEGVVGGPLAAHALERQEALLREVFARRGLPSFAERTGLVLTPEQRGYNTGLLLAAPGAVADLFEEVYRDHEDLGAPEYNYEQWFLLDALFRRGLVNTLDPRFNAIWDLVRAINYPFLSLERPFLSGSHNCVRAALANAYFLHFANRPEDIRFCVVPDGREELRSLVTAELAAV